MKKLKKLSLASMLLSMLFLGACKDDTDPVDGGNGNQATDCKVVEVKDDESTGTMTYNGDKLVKMSQIDTSGAEVVQEFKYDANGRLTEIVETDDGDVYTYKIQYNSEGQIIQVDEYDEDGNLLGPYKLTYDNDGNLIKVDEYWTDNGMDILVADYSYTYKDGELSGMTNINDLNDDGKLDPMDDLELSVTITATDGKKNPMYGLPIYLTSFGNFAVFMKSNLVEGSLTFFGNTVTVTGSYTYNDQGYPTKATLFTGDSNTVEYMYQCD